MNHLPKFKHKTSTHNATVLSFRFNPGDDDLQVKSETIEEVSPTDEAHTERRESSGSETDAKSRKNSGADESAKPDSNGIEVKEPASQSDQSNKDSSRDSSPLKESVKEYFSKVGKRSSSLDYSSSGADNEGWSLLSGIKGKIVKKMEDATTLYRSEKLKKGYILDTVQEKKTETKAFISSRSHSSTDVRSRIEEDSSTSVEEGLDCAAADDSQVPYSYHMSEEDGAFVGFSHNSSQSGPSRKSAVASVASSAQALLARRRSKNISPPNTSPGPITLSSLKATRSFESEILEDNDIDDDTWEHVEDSKRLEEKPEEPMIFQGTSTREEESCQSELSASDKENDPQDKKLWTLLLQPTIRKKLTGLVVLILAICFAPISNFLSGFLLGALTSAVTGSFLLWILQAPKPKEQINIPNYSTLPPLRIPSWDILKEESTIFKGWMNQLPCDYDSDTYHVNSTHSVFVRLDGTSLRLSKPKVNVPKRAMWNEPKYTPIFVAQQHIKIANAQVSLPPEGLAKRRLWSKKYPICLVINDAQATHQGSQSSEEESSEIMPTPTGRETVLYLFARTPREKEEWFNRFQLAAQSALPQQLQDEEPPNIDYHTYGRWIVSEESILSYVKGACPTNDPRYGDTTPEHVWLNALIGRVFYDFLTKKFWSEVVAERIQRKLSVIKVPFFMEELKLKDINLGLNLPILHRMSRPIMDNRGLWVDFDVTYKGTFQMTLETKLNLLKLKKEQVETMTLSLDENISQNPKSYMCNSDEESSAESSSEEEGSPPDTTDQSPEDGAHASARVASTSKTLLRWVDKITQSRYFQQATENRYIKRAMTEVSNTPLVLTVEVHALVGTVAINVPPPPSDRLWYGFRGNPQLSITARPKLGLHEVTFAHVTEWIEKKLALEFQKLLVMPNMDDIVIPIMESGLHREEKSFQS